MNIGDLSVPPFQNIGDEIFHSLNVVGNNSNSSIKYMINRDHWNLGLYQPLNFFGKKVDTGDHNSIDSSVTTVFIIIETLSGEITTGESDIVSFGFSSSLKTFEYMIEVIMCETTHGFVYKEYAKIVTSFGF